MGGKGSGGKRKNTPPPPGTERDLIVDPGDNARYILNNLEIMNLPDIDIDNAEQVRDRIQEYFAIRVRQDMKPTVSGLAMALGMNRRALWAITHDQPLNGQGYRKQLKPEVSVMVKKAYEFMEQQWEDYMQNGKINPVSGIFLGKNNYGYQDKQEVVLTPNQNLGDEQNAEQLTEKYLDSVVIDEDE